MVITKHYEVAIALGDIFIKHFPNSSYGIAGSVANNMHNPNSDLDLLLLDKSFKKNRQYVFIYKDIEVNILCVNPEFFKRKLEDYILFFDSQHIGYIKNCRIIHDRNNQLNELKKFVTSLIEAKLSNSGIICEKIEVFIDNYLNSNHSIRDLQGIVAIRFLISYWFVKKGKILLEKSDIKKTFDDLIVEDESIYNSLLLLIDHNSEVLKLFVQIYKIIKNDSDNNMMAKGLSESKIKLV